MTRWKAFSIHLALCAILYAILLYLIVLHWYPQPYFAAEGGWQGVQLLTGVDLVLGPVLTLIVFKPGKPWLKRDLAIIGFIQVTALIWGTWLVGDQRLAMITYVDGAFYTLTHDLVEDAGGKAPMVLVEASAKPTYAFVRLPVKGEREQRQFLLQAIMSARPPYLLGDFYESLDRTNTAEVLAHGVAIDTYITLSEENRQALDEFLSRHGGKAEDYAFLPLYCRYAKLMLALRRVDGSVIDTLAIRPHPRLLNTGLR